MKKINMIIGKDKLYLFVKNSSGYERQVIGGNPAFEYDLNNAKRDVDRLIDLLVDEYNLETKAELEFDVICNEDTLCNEVIGRCFDSLIVNETAIESVISDVCKKLTRDNELLIDEYGVNFDGKCYLKKGNEYKKMDYSLLAYTLTEDSILRFLG